MSNSHNSHPKEKDEIDLRDIKIAIASFLEAIGFFVFKVIAFILRKWYFVGIALLISFYLNFNALKSHFNTTKTAAIGVSYDILLAPQYESIDYLDQLVSEGFKDKISETEIRGAKLTGVDDLYHFLSEDSLNMAVFKSSITKLTDFEDIIHNYPLSKNYRFQLLTIDGSSAFDIDNFVLRLGKYFNEIPLFKAKQKIENQRIDAQIKALQQELALAESLHSKDIKEVKKQQYVIDQLAKLEQQKITASDVIYVMDYFKVESKTVVISPVNKLAKDSFKYVIFLLLLGVLIDLVKHYRQKK